MGKRSKKRVNKIKCRNKASSSEKNTETASRRNAEIKTHEKKVSKDNQRSDVFQEPRNFRIVTEETDDKESINICTEDEVAEQNSQLKEPDMIDKEVEEMFYAIDESLVIDNCVRDLNSRYKSGRISLVRYLEMSNFLAGKYRKLSMLFVSQNPLIIENIEKCAVSKGKEGVPNPSSIVESAKEISEIELMSKVFGGGNETDSKLANVKDVDGMITDLRNGHGMNLRLDDIDISVEDIQKAASSTQLLIAEKKDKKYGEEYSGSSQNPENSPHNMELDNDEEMVKKIEDVTNESVQELIDGFKISDMNESEAKKFKEFYRWMKLYLHLLRTKSFIDMKNENIRAQSLLNSLSKDRHIYVSKTLVINKNTKNLEVKPSKEQEDQINEIIAELIKTQSLFCQNATEVKKVGNEGNSDESNDDIQDSHFRKEMPTVIGQAEGCERKDEKTIYPKKRVLKADFKRDLKEFMKLQNSKIDDRVKEYRAMGSTIQQPGHFSEKGPLMDEAKTKSHENTDNTTDFGENIDENEATVEENEPDEIVIELDKNDDIRFEIKTDDETNVLARDYCNSFKNITHTFSFKSENIQVTFNGYQIFISTPKSEFDISIRNDARYLKEKSNPFNLADEATQTRDLQ